MKLPSYQPTIMYSRPIANELPLDYEPLRGAIVPLEDADFAQAQHLSHRWRQAAQAVQPRWSVYLHMLALRAFQHWFHQRSLPTVLDLSQTFILSPDRFDAQQPNVKGHIAVCQIQVAPFKIGLVVTDGMADEWWIPVAAIRNPQFAAHFYLPIVIHEEAGQAEILGFLQHNQLPEMNTEDRYCRLAIAQANPDLERLLLYLTCLEPMAIPLPEATPAPQAAFSQVTFSQGFRQLLVQPVVRTQQWLNRQVDMMTERLGEAIATELAPWQILPALEFAPATRSFQDLDLPMADLSAILMSLMRRGMQLPIEQASAYQDLQLDDLALRLYVVTAPRPIDPDPAIPESTITEPILLEWSLLVVLRRQDRIDLPQGVSLQIADANAVLVDQQAEMSQSDFLYGSVIGNTDEQFTVTLSYQNQHLTLPPFTFE
ncbi:MAG: DUF1822 family protein [Synechococcales bacterium]|nr:DUF1822 family protein [Synechococcales bacterium]